MDGGPSATVSGPYSFGGESQSASSPNAPRYWRKPSIPLASIRRSKRKRRQSNSVGKRRVTSRTRGSQAKIAGLSRLSVLLPSTAERELVVRLRLRTALRLTRQPWLSGVSRKTNPGQLRVPSQPAGEVCRLILGPHTYACLGLDFATRFSGRAPGDARRDGRLGAPQPLEERPN